ncbi:MAG: type II secretion system F family protein [Candidatus Ozemobacteraceae bacterium]
MSDLQNLFLQLETTIGSGIPIVRALRLIGGNLSGRMKRQVEGMADAIDRGGKFSGAVKAAGRPFSPMHVAFIKFGEEAGCLDKVCGALAIHAEKEMSLERGIIGGLMYPVFVLFVALIIGPVFNQIAVQQQAWQTAIVPALINVGVFLVVIFGGYYGFKSMAAGALDTILVNIPIIGPILKNIALARFTRALAVSQNAGVPIVQALKTAIEVSDNCWLMNKLKELPSLVEKGEKIGTGLDGCGAIPGTLREMILVGEESGRLPEMLDKTATFYEEEANNKVSVLMKIMPVFIFLIVAVYVGYMIVGNYLTVFSRMAGE